MTQPHVRDLHNLIEAAELDVLVTPIKLVRFPGREALRNEGRGDRVPPALPLANMPAHRIHRTDVAFQAQPLEHPLRRAPLPCRELLLQL